MGIAREQQLGRYELLIELGHGGMAELFLARLRGAGGFAKLVAIKRILPHLARDEQFTSMFLEEGRIAAALSHPNICQVFELDDANGELFLAMEYLDGVPWAGMLTALPLEHGGPPLSITAGVLVQAAEGLHYAHALRDVTGSPTPVVHRDVSPQNLFVTVDGVCKVLDFGVAKMMTDGPRTKSGVVKGKLPYMAPEQIRGEPVDARTDVFSLGVCLWEALAGERLYDRATDFLIWKAVTEEDAPAITTRWPGCPPAVAEVVRRALAREPADRIPTARAFADQLRAAVPALATTAQIGDALRASCGDRLAARQELVASAIKTRSLPPRDEPPRGERADGRRSYETVHSAAETLESGRSAAMTLDDKPLAIDPGATTDLRSGSKHVQLRDKSMVVTRDPDQALEAATTIPRKPLSQERIDAHVSGSSLGDPQAMAAAKQSRLGLVIGALVAAAVIAVVLVIVLRSGSTPAGAADAALATADAAVAVAVDAAIALDVATPAADAGPGSSYDDFKKLPPPPPPQHAWITVWITSKPAGADVYLDDRKLPSSGGKTMAFQPQGSTLEVECRLAGYRPAKLRINFDGKTTTARCVLEKLAGAPSTDSQPPAAAPGLLSVTSDPYATIYVDGTQLGDTPLFRSKVPAGRHTVRAVRGDGREKSFPVEIEAGKERNLGMLAW